MKNQKFKLKFKKWTTLAFNTKYWALKKMVNDRGLQIDALSINNCFHNKNLN